MTEPEQPEPDFWIDIYKGRARGRQAWRWRAVRRGNNRKMATGGESYTNLQDCVDAVNLLFGTGTRIHMMFPDGEIEIVR